MSSPSPLATLFLTEAILKVIGGSIFFISPSTILKNLQSPPYPPISLCLIRSLGTQTIAFSIPLFLAARSEGKSKRIVYWTLLGREGLLGLGLLAQVGWSYFSEWREQHEEVDVKALEEGFAAEKRGQKEDEQLEVLKLRKGIWLWTAELVPFIVGRIWILKQREAWFA